MNNQKIEQSHFLTKTELALLLEQTKILSGNDTMHGNSLLCAWTKQFYGDEHKAKRQLMFSIIFPDLPVKQMRSVATGVINLGNALGAVNSKSTVTLANIRARITNVAEPKPIAEKTMKKQNDIDRLIFQIAESQTNAQSVVIAELIKCKITDDFGETVFAANKKLREQIEDLRARIKGHIRIIQQCDDADTCLSEVYSIDFCDEEINIIKAGLTVLERFQHRIEHPERYIKDSAD